MRTLPPLGRSPDGAAPLPPVPLVRGPLEIRVVYPRAGTTITSRDSNFIFGAVGDGTAALRINGTPVPVLPNGSFLAFLPNPDSANPVYELLATRDADSTRVSHPVVLQPARMVFQDAGAFADLASVLPRGNYALPDDETIRIGVRAAPTALAWVELADGSRRTLYHASPNAMSDSLRQYGNAERWATDLPARLLRAPATIVVARGADTVRVPIARVAPPDSAGARLVMLGARTTAVSDTDRVLVGRPVPAGTYKWFFLPGTVLETTARAGDTIRVRLDRTLDAWVGAEDATDLSLDAPAPRRRLSSIRFVPADEWVDVRLATGEPPAYLMEQDGASMVLTLYQTVVGGDLRILHVANDSLVRHVTWEPVASDRTRLTLHLGARPFGYMVFWDRGVFVLRLRRTPAIERRRPLAGLTIAVDAGHPPVGATGPTGVWEPELTLPIAEKLKTLLEARGARVVMTRTTADAVALGDRPIMARRANAHAFVSIHLNALPDGVNPFRAHGTETYYFHPQSEPLARAVQRGMVRTMGLRDLGAHYANLAIARTSWMPSVLCEGAFIMIPEQEAALQTEEYQLRYARGVADGLEQYFRSLGQQP